MTFSRSRMSLTLRRVAASLVLLATAALAAPPARAADEGEDLVKLDFQNADLTAVIDTIARLTGRNFIYDDRVRGRVTIVSPTPMPLDQAYAVFESVLQVKGFTTVRTPGGALKVIPLREAKETSVETSTSMRPPVDRDTFITRLIPLRYIEAESIVNTIKPLVSKDAAIAAYEPTNTVILTESASNIRRLIAILEAIDIETYREELAVIRVEFADATVMADQISQIFGATVTATGPTPARRRRGQPAAAPPVRPPGELGKVRILTDERTNALIVLAPRTQLEEVRRLVRKLDVPVIGGGRIHVYYLQHADAEELAQTLTSMISGVPVSAAPAAAAGGGQAQALRATVAGLAEGISVTADPATNSLVIQASQEGFNTISAVIAKLDVVRPQVLVEALIMEVDITDREELGFAGVVRLASGDTEYAIALGADAAAAAFLGGVPAVGGMDGIGGLPGTGDIFGGDGGPAFLGGFRTDNDKSTIQGIIRAAARDAGTNIISAPHILTSDNEEAEIRIGDNIPIISSRVQSAAGVVGSTDQLATSVNVERQDIGVTLRVTPQITEGDALRLDIFQELTATNESLQDSVGDVNSVGPALSNRRIENTVVVADGETVVVGGLLSDVYEDSVTKVPWLGDIPVIGWLFKSTDRSLRKVNLLIFLTPHIIRSQEDLEKETIRKRQEFVEKAHNALRLSEREQAAEQEKMKEAEEAGEVYTPGRGLNPVRHAVLDHEARYPLERMREIERLKQEEEKRRAQEQEEVPPEYFLQAGLFADEKSAVDVLTSLLDLGFDGALLSSERGGRVLYEVRIGPYDSVESASEASKLLERTQGLAPTILLNEPEAPEEPEAP